MNRQLQVLPFAIIGLLKSLFQVGKWLSLSHVPAESFDIGKDFIGVNVAPADDPEVDDYILAQLTELGLRQVRMDFTYNSINAPAQRLLDKLLATGHRVSLKLIPPLEEAAILYKNPTAQARWADFLADMFQTYQHRVECFEIGATPNRGLWSGFSSRSILAAWDSAIEVAENFTVTLAGPNVSDFEPIFNATYLSLFQRAGRVPAIHTDNLFVERVMEPEAYDHKVLGKLATGFLKLNLIKKARILDRIGKDSGSVKTWCTYTCWTKKRLARQAAWPEDKAADYLVRYLALAAASGALDRVYWGPLICSRDGLISTGCQDYPAIDQVSFYQRVHGELDDFSITPVFMALKHSAARFLGAHCIASDHQTNGVHLFRMKNAQGMEFELCWCRDGEGWPLLQFFEESALARASFYNALGGAIPRPAVLSEHPLFIEFKGPVAPSTALHLTPQNIIHLSSPQSQSISYYSDDWLGAYMLRSQQQCSDLAQLPKLSPAAINDLEESAVLRDTRNRLWNVKDPRERTGAVTIKLNRAKGFKRISYRFRPSKGRRHWNNACEMLRRGVDTPLPVAFFERPKQAGIRDSLYLCEFIPGAFSAREVYAAFRDGAAQFKGLDKAAWFELLSKFICQMHNRQIVHRDLSSGNLLLWQDTAGVIHPMLIDIGRAWLGRGSRIGQRHRLVDPMRIAYTLNWADRVAFIQAYESHMGSAFSPAWRIPFRYYDYKQGLKKGLKAKYRKTRKT